ncbi:uncharacterized protein N7498_001552 [Penicillium cinerascens]|uniref:Uncharacterized protein n=1 Tax=Penicillium cinerascens TaxID=70096 RepID=A0A9W9TE89_9EURO|nr:uncharacterized protein N7498_001552 [Penicillium cinerascens]KAJ5219453.1 hypothetical protein N7498_001552 [Penicillium cinerascens]
MADVRNGAAKSEFTGSGGSPIAEPIIKVKVLHIRVLVSSAFGDAQSNMRDPISHERVDRNHEWKLSAKSSDRPSVNIADFKTS